MTPADLPASEPAVLVVNLAALRANYEKLRALAGEAECAAVVKANAYGLDVRQAVPALLASGCRTFFVATPKEALDVRAMSTDCTVYVLDGLLPGTSQQYVDASLRPVLGSLEQLHEWRGTAAPAALHADTGMSRLGLQPSDVDALADDPASLNDTHIDLFMSHLACGDDRKSDMNTQQRNAFVSSRQRLGIQKGSLANSAGTLFGPDYHFDLVRPGIALYGGEAINDEPNPMRPVVSLYAQILQVRDLSPGDPIGYGSTYRVSRPSRIATIGAGYADGVFRSLSSADNQPPATVRIHGTPAPVVGRVSMDLITIDVTDIPDVQRGHWAELLGEHITVDDVARRAGTIGYEVLTRLGQRYHRIYVGA